MLSLTPCMKWLEMKQDMEKLSKVYIFSEKSKTTLFHPAATKLK